MRLESWCHDLKYAARQLRRSPGFTLVAISALAIGVGANITLFSLVNGWLVRPLDAQEPGRLVRVTGPGGSSMAAGATGNDANILPADYVQYRERNQTFSALAAGGVGGPTAVRWNGPAQMIPVTPVTGNYFEMLGVTAALGRTLTPADARERRQVIVLSDAGWRRFFRADPAVIGTTAFLDGVPHVVVGVLGESFTGTTAPMIPQIYRPLHEAAGELGFPFRLLVLGRLQPGVSPAQARADLQRIATQLTAGDRRLRSIEIYAARSTMPFMLRALLVVTVMFALIVGVVLLITCDNIAILTALRAAARSRDIAVRLALGASRSRILVQLMLESALLCAAAGAVATDIAFTTARFATQFYVPVPMPFALTFKPDWRVIAFAILASCLAMVLCGLIPALKALNTDLVTTLRGDTLGHRVQAGLVMAQMALSTALLVSAGVLAHSVLTVTAESRPFTSSNVVMTTIALGGGQYTAARRLSVIERFLGRVEASPGVSAAAAVANVPGANNAPLPPAVLRSGERSMAVEVNLASRGLFRTLTIPVLAGRDFSVQDDAAPASVGIVNESLARSFWPAGSPIGKTLQDGKGAVIQVIGLVRDTEYASPDAARRPYLYRPLALEPTTSPTVLMKTAGNTTPLLSAVRSYLGDIDPDIVGYNVMVLDDRLNLPTIVSRTAAIVSGCLGLLALALGALGIYGTMSFLVQQRRREIGIRMALGASRADVIGYLSKQGMRWAAAGTLVGLGLAGLASLGLSRVVRGVTPGDPLAFAAASVALLSVAYMACRVPARRASRVDPMVALRVD